MGSLSGKVIAVTGGAGHLGSAICRGLSDAGALVHSISSKPVDTPWVKSHFGDLADEDALEKIFRTDIGSIDGLVNCAGRASRHARLDQFDEQPWRDIENTAELFLKIVRNSVPVMSNGGSIATVASMWGELAPTMEIYAGSPNEPSYGGAAANGAILSVVRHLAVHLAAKAIRVNALVPGWFPKKNGTPNPDYMRRITERVPLGRIGYPGDLVGPAAFLMSSASAYMTGQQLIIDGGYSIR